MDPEIHRSSFSLFMDRDESASGPSALRTSTRSPSFRRLSLMMTASSSASTTDSISIHSTESHIPPQLSCVIRDIPRDECAFHRFMIWVAVKRNECVRMTPTERRECPLLRCRKRFANHEQMLRHLYSCEELETGEYWCYDCERTERFADAKFKRCLGSPKKRRKILSAAKSFFTSMGHKSKKDGLLKSPHEDSLPMLPPSYDSLSLLHASELSSTTEIHEADSREVVPMPPTEPVPTQRPVPTPMPAPDSNPQPEPESSYFLSSIMYQPTPPCIFPAELDTSLPLADDPIDGAAASWINSPMASVPFEHPPYRHHSTDEHRVKTRSKTLAPSSSLRSNASNSSTNSTGSTDSTNTTSTGISISPSIFSEAWTVASEMDTDLESPIDNLFYSSKTDSEEANTLLYDDTLEGDVFMQDFVSELPAEIPPFSQPHTPPEAPLTGPQDLDSFRTSTEKGPDFAMQATGHGVGLEITEDVTRDVSAEESPNLELGLPFSPFVEPTSLVASISETMQAHVFSSEAKLRPVTNNSLAAQFLRLDTRAVASLGHATLGAILRGAAPDSPLHLLCYVHVVYTYFLVVHKEEAGAHSRALFAQALSYASIFAGLSRVEYLEVARVVWEPDDLDEIVSHDSVSAQSQSAGNSFAKASPVATKGKEPDYGPGVDLQGSDALLTAAQYLLDGFEYSILPADIPHSLEILSSEIWASHVMEASLVSSDNTYAAFEDAIGSIVHFIRQRFSPNPGLMSALQLVKHRASKRFISTARRVELELLQAAHRFVPRAAFINQYAPFVRQQCDILYSTRDSSTAWRHTYYDQAVRLVDSMIPGTVRVQPDEKSHQTGDLDDDFLALVTPFISDSADISPTATTTSPGVNPVGFGGSAVASSSGGSRDTVSPQSSPPRSEQQATPYPSTPQSGPGDAGGVPKVEADACCDICGYRPKGDPQWFKGSMSKHKRLQHSTAPPQIYKCPFPGCTSQYKNRPDNLRQHQLDKGHFVEGEELTSSRPGKRRRT